MRFLLTIGRAILSILASGCGASRSVSRGLLLDTRVLLDVYRQNLGGERNLEGRVVADETDMPIAGVKVEITGTRLGMETNDNSAYQFSGLDHGRCGLFVSAANFQSCNYSVEINPDQISIVDFRLAVDGGASPVRSYEKDLNGYRMRTGSSRGWRGRAIPFLERMSLLPERSSVQQRTLMDATNWQVALLANV